MSPASRCGVAIFFARPKKIAKKKGRARQLPSASPFTPRGGRATHVLCVVLSALGYAEIILNQRWRSPLSPDGERAGERSARGPRQVTISAHSTHSSASRAQSIVSRCRSNIAKDLGGSGRARRGLSETRYKSTSESHWLP